MSKALLEIQNLHVRVEEKEILHGVDLTVGQDETHVLMGPNGTGKSTLGYAITGNPTYSVTGGSIIFNGEDITELPVNERAKKGIFLSFQNPLEVPGVTLSAFIRSALEQKTGDRLRLWDFKKKLKETMALLNMDESYAERDLNVGFSGGEKKKAEILQMLMLEPKLAILDETDSGLDVDAVRTVSEGVRLFRERTHGSLLIITHSTRILDALATLSFNYPRRAEYFSSELETFLLMARSESDDPLDLKGSFAGAMGYGQFMPSSYRQYAVDFNGDGHINLWDPVDAIGSVANYFKQHGWVSGDTVAVQALGQAPGLDNGFKTKYSISQLSAAGLTPTQPLGNHQQASLLRLDIGTGYQYWYGLPNFYTITRYNHSTHYAMAVWQLGLAVSQARGGY